MCCSEHISERRLSTDMQVATASVSIAPFTPVLMPLDDEVKDEECVVEEEVKLEFPPPEQSVAWKDLRVPDEHMTTPPVSPMKKLRRQKAFFMSPPATPTKKAFVDLTKKELPPCCLMMPSGKEMPAVEHVIVAFLTGASIGSALVICFSDRGLVEE